VNSTGDRVAISLALLSLLTLVLGLLGMAEAFGVAAVGVILLPIWFGWRSRSNPSRVRSLLAACAALYAVLILLIFQLDRPEAAQPEIWLGYPPSTAVFVYAVWPLGILPALVYGVYFSKQVLSDEDLASFLERHSKHRPSAVKGAPKAE
jgi:hypothetical protein